ncbi:unnamed protein product [Prunus brigantina]
MGGGAWPFLVGGAICLVNSVNERDLSLLTSYAEDPSAASFLEGLWPLRPRKFEAITAKCDTWCELQNPVNHRVFERKLRPKPLGRGARLPGRHTSLPPHLLLRDCGGADDGLPCASPRGWHKCQVLGDARHDNRWLRNLGCPSCAVVAH